MPSTRIALLVSTVCRQFFLFERSNIEILKAQGCEVHCAADFSEHDSRLDSLGVVQHHVSFDRSPFSSKNIGALLGLKKLIKALQPDLIHCHSPMGGVVSRLASWSERNRKPVLYTAHGFHFFKGAPLLNWLIYFPVEVILSRTTDCIITINEEDYRRAKSFGTCKVVYVPGVGIDISGLRRTECKSDARRSIGVRDGQFVVLMVGEFIKRKNHRLALDAFANAFQDDWLLLFCGKGVLQDELQRHANELGIGSQVRFLGYRGDINRVMAASDVYIFPSHQEGLPVSVMEAMAMGLPVICSRIRGNIELIDDSRGGFLVEADDVQGFSRALSQLANSCQLRQSMGSYNQEKAADYDVSKVEASMEALYRSYLGGGAGGVMS
jgi:glycosyltransferase involved in cell wall biosynthesis